MVGGGSEFTALMLHQCAAVVAVNLHIDQTAEPKGIRRCLISGAGAPRVERSRRLGSTRLGVSDSGDYRASSRVPSNTNTNTHLMRAAISAFQTRVCTGSCTMYLGSKHVESQADWQIHSVPLEEIRMQSGSLFPPFFFHPLFPQTSTPTPSPRSAAQQRLITTSAGKQ